MEAIYGKVKKLIVTSDASGAQQCAREGMLVVIVDVIDMSTTLESALDGELMLCLGSVLIIPGSRLRYLRENRSKASSLAKEKNTSIIIIL